MDEMKDSTFSEGIVDAAPVFPSMFERDCDDSRMSDSPASQKGSISDKTYSPEVMNKANNLEKRVLMLTARAEQNQDVLILDPDTGAIVNEDENSSSSSTVYDQMLGRKKNDGLPDSKGGNRHRQSDHGTDTGPDTMLANEFRPRQPGEVEGLDIHVVTTKDLQVDHSVALSQAESKSEGKPVLSCSYCPRAFTHVGHLKRHMNMHAPDKQLQCNVCGKIFKRTDKFRIHMRIHTGERPHVCFVCDKRFNRAHHLTRHLLIHVRQGVINIDMVKGKGNIKEIVGEPSLPAKDENHLEPESAKNGSPQNDEELIISAEIEDEDEGESSDEEEGSLDKDSSDRPEDDSEVVIILSEDAEGQGPSLMSAADKFSNVHSGTQHGQSPRRKAKPKKIYNCQHCDKIFDRPSRLITHLSNHILEKGKNGVEEDVEKLKEDESDEELKKDGSQGPKSGVFSCDECGKVFPRQDRLNIHLRIHTGERPYVCQICERRFSRSHHLSRHILTHSGIKNYRCKFCLKWYSTAYYLKEHMQIRHAEDLAKEGGLANVDFSPQKDPLVMKKEALEEKAAHSRYLVSDTGELINKEGDRGVGSEVREFIITENGEIVEGGDDEFGDSQLLVVVPQESVEHKSIDLRGNPKAIKTPKIFACEYCGKTFSTSSHLKRHTYNHTGDKPHGCTVCGKRFARMDKLRIHHRIHSGERPYSCQLCKKTFARSDLLSRHMFLHPEAISFSTKGDFGETAKEGENGGHFSDEGATEEGKTNGQDDEGKDYAYTNLVKREPKEKRLHPCPECGKLFPRPSRLAAHIRLHSGEKPYECKECGKKFTRANHLNVHHRIHTGERPHVCQVCSRGFNRSHHLQRHMLIHTGEKPFPCQYCEKRYSRAAHLKDHMLNHHKETMLAIEGPEAVQGTPFISRLSETHPSMVTDEGTEDVVDRMASGPSSAGTSNPDSGLKHSLDDSSSLLGSEGAIDNAIKSEGDTTDRELSRETTGSSILVDLQDEKFKQSRDVKLYPCKHCDMVFYRQSHFERHVLLHEGKKPYECDECGKGFAGKDRLRVHKRIHTGERPYVCNICSKSFGRSHHLKRHLVSHSGVKPFQCEFCNKRYSASYHLKDHINNHHVLEMALKQEHQTGKGDALSFVLVNNDHEASLAGEDEKGVLQEVHSVNSPKDNEDGEVFAKSSSPNELFSPDEDQHYPEEDEDDEEDSASKENDSSLKMKLSSRAHQCQHCERIFDRPSRLQSHMYTHTGEKPHTCDECGKSFGGLDRLRVHRRIHTGVKPYVCQVCSKAFGRAYHLTRHMASHTGNKQYQCHYCDKKFSTSSYMKQHQKLSHASEPGYTSDGEQTSDGPASDADEDSHFDEALDPREKEKRESLNDAECMPTHSASVTDLYDSSNLNDQLLFLVGQEVVRNQTMASSDEKPATLTPLNDPATMTAKDALPKRNETNTKSPAVEHPFERRDVEVNSVLGQVESQRGPFFCSVCHMKCENAGSLLYHQEQHRLTGHEFSE